LGFVPRSFVDFVVVERIGFILRFGDFCKLLRGMVFPS